MEGMRAVSVPRPVLKSDVNTGERQVIRDRARTEQQQTHASGEEGG